MIMNVANQNQMWPRTCITVPILAIMSISIGVYLLSLQRVTNAWTVLISSLIPLGIMGLIIWVLQSIIYIRDCKTSQRRGAEQHLEIYAIDRHCTFPPSYAESLVHQDSSDTLPESVVVDVQMGLAPPLYCEDGSQAPDCSLSWEQPPRYSQEERQEQEEGTLPSH